MTAEAPRSAENKRREYKKKLISFLGGRLLFKQKEMGLAAKVLLLVTDLEIGGTPTVVRELAIRLSANVEVACLSKWGPVADEIRAAGIEVTAFGANKATDLHVIFQLVRFIREKQFGTVFSFLIHANIAAAVASCFCRDVRWIQSIQTTQPNPRWHWMLQKIAQNFAEKIAVPSPSAAKVAREWADVPLEKIEVIPNAVDPAALPIHWQRSSEVTRIGFLGRLDPIKRVPDLVRAMTLLDNRFTLHIFGDGEDRTRIESEISKLKLQNRVTLHGVAARPQAAMQQMDLLVLPSEAEGFGLVLIEAMSCGIPVVATNVSGIRDVVRDEITGLLVPVAQPEKIAAAIERVANDDSLRQRLTEAAFDDVQNRFTWPAVLKQYRSLLNLEDA